MFLRVAALAAAFTIALASAASAQTVLTLDRQRVLTESVVGQHISSRIEAIGQEINSELETQRAPIEQESQRLEAETQALTPEGLQQRPDLMQRINALQGQANEFQRAQQVAVRELQATEAQALRPVSQAVGQIIRDIATERQASAVFNQGSLLYYAPATDITSDVISRLNAQLQTVEVTRVRLPEQQQQAAQSQ